MAYTLNYSLINNNTEYSVNGYTGEPTDVVIPSEYNGLPVTSIGNGAFAGCSNLTSMEIGDNVTTIGVYAFSGCSSLTSVVIPDSVTTIGDGAFSGCSSLTNVAIGDSVTTIGGNAFYGCDSLMSVEIGDSVTTIGSGAFGSCDSLTSVVIPNSVTSIGNSAFNGCSGLTKVILLAKTPASLLGTSVFSSNPTFYCFSGAIKAYKTASNWNTYADNFVADDMRLYFIMNASAQKKYFASKEWVQAQGYGAAPAIYSPEETESNSTFSFDATNLKEGHLYRIIIESLAHESGAIGGSLDFIYNSSEALRLAYNSVFLMGYSETLQPIYYPNAHMYAYYDSGYIQLFFDSADSNISSELNPNYIKLVEVK